MSRSKELAFKELDEKALGGSGALAHAGMAMTRFVLQFIFGDLKVRQGATSKQIEEAVRLLELGKLDPKIRQHFAPENLLEAAEPLAFEDVKPFDYARWKARHSR